jgi:carbon storage regulator CsrA
MLVLNRRQGERIVIGPDTELTVLEVRGKRVRLAFTAPATTTIRRAELPCHRPPDRQDQHPCSPTTAPPC